MIVHVKYKTEQENKGGKPMNSSQSPRRCTLQDIAERTGYTINTVSRALKNKSDISVATREHIQQVADERG